ncbi:MAG: hypothetical protein N2594_06495 [Clostridiales bacterium]|nr:hypothetical protein [Clostridiales bacterium]
MLKKSLNDFFKNQLAVVPAIILAIITSLFQFNRIDYSEFENVPPHLIMESISKILLSILLLFIVAIFLTPLFESWSFVLIKDKLKDKPSDLKQSFKTSLKYYLRVLGISTINNLIFLVISLIYFITLASIAFSKFKLHNYSRAILGLIGPFIAVTIIFLLAILFFTVTLMPTIPSTIMNDYNFSSGFANGFRLGIKKFFPILGVTILVMFPVLIISLLISKYNFSKYLLTLLSSYLKVFLNVYLCNLALVSMSNSSEIIACEEIEINENTKSENDIDQSNTIE